MYVESRRKEGREPECGKRSPGGGMRICVNQLGEIVGSCVLELSLGALSANYLAISIRLRTRSELAEVC